MDLTGDRLRLTTGIEDIEDWAETADERDRADVYALLFAVVDSALLRAYPVLGGEDDSTLSVLVRPDLAVCLVFPGPGEFGVLAIGDPRCAADVDGDGVLPFEADPSGLPS